jgi:hypothetical protein
MYRDRERQREANRVHARAYRSRKGMTQGMTIKGEGMTESIIPTIIPIIKTKADAVEAVREISKDWRTPKVVGCRRFGENPEAA